MSYPPGRTVHAARPRSLRYGRTTSRLATPPRAPSFETQRIHQDTQRNPSDVSTVALGMSGASVPRPAGRPVPAHRGRARTCPPSGSLPTGFPPSGFPPSGSGGRGGGTRPCSAGRRRPGPAGRRYGCGWASGSTSSTSPGGRAGGAGPARARLPGRRPGRAHAAARRRGQRGGAAGAAGLAGVGIAAARPDGGGRGRRHGRATGARRGRGAGTRDRPGRGGCAGGRRLAAAPVPGSEVEASLPALSAVGGRAGAPDLVRLVDTVAAHCHRVRLRRAYRAHRACHADPAPRASG